MKQQSMTLVNLPDNQHFIQSSQLMLRNVGFLTCFYILVEVLEKMASTETYSGLIQSPEAVIFRFKSILISIDPELALLIDFNRTVQKNNLIDLVYEANLRIKEYENIYPYIKELCQNQTINPDWYMNIEKVLSWALNKGRGPKDHLGDEIKDAWLTYIILLSCAMIDKVDDFVGGSTLERLTSLKSRKRRIRESN